MSSRSTVRRSPGPTTAWPHSRRPPHRLLPTALTDSYAGGERRTRLHLNGRAPEDALSEACTVRATIELDLHEVSFIDSTGIRAILAAKASCADQDVELLMVPSRHQAPHRVFELSG